MGLLLLLACQVGGCLGVARFQAMGVMQKDCTVGMHHAAVVMQVKKNQCYKKKEKLAAADALSQPTCSKRTACG